MQGVTLTAYSPQTFELFEIPSRFACATQCYSVILSYMEMRYIQQHQPQYEQQQVQLYTREQVAQALVLSERQVDLLVKRGELKAVRIGRSVRFTREAIAEFIASKSV